MGLYRDEGIVLRTHKLGEADRILHLYTHDRVRVGLRVGGHLVAPHDGAAVAAVGIGRGRVDDLLVPVEHLAPADSAAREQARHPNHGHLRAVGRVAIDDDQAGQGVF
mgnify:CR=1 FL=1